MELYDHETNKPAIDNIWGREIDDILDNQFEDESQLQERQDYEEVIRANTDLQFSF